jgi:predicted metal-dependent HD superfamily phosphohydrolase
MTDSQPNLLSAAREFATDILLNKVSKSLKYHNLDHTQSVVLACEEMANYYQLQPDDREALLIAAWFHDTGYSAGQAKGHEDASISLATTFLQDQKAEAGLVQKIASCIEATRIPQTPKNLIEQIICDADLFHLGTDEFKIKNEALRQELLEFSREDISKKKWRKLNIPFMENHKYFTDYCRRKLQPVKEQHIEELKARDGEHDKDKDKNKDKSKPKKKSKENDVLSVFTEDPNKENDAKKKKEKDGQLERGISTVFRIIASNHANLSHMADNKAHIMISVNSIIMSVVISLLIRHLDENRNLVLPTILLVLVCVSATIYAVLATRPNVSQGTFTREDIQAKKTNLLFFGNFHNMTLPDYDWAMKEMLGDRDYLYGSMIKDIYFLGVVLAKKYKYLRISYSIFMYGLILAMLAFAATMAWDAFFVTTTVQTV